MTRFSSYLGTLAAVLLLSAGAAVAAPEKPGAEKKNEPSSGVISSSERRGFRSTVVDTAWSGMAGKDTPDNPIAGSVSRLSPREWKMVLANNSEDPYSIDLSVQQIDKRGSVSKTDHYSYTLKGGEKVERMIPSALNAVDAKLNLGRWKSLATKAQKGEGAPESADAPATR